MDIFMNRGDTWSAARTDEDRDLPKPTKAYGFRAVSTFEPYDWENSRASSSRNKKASLRGYDFSAMVRYMTPSDIR